MLFAVEFGTPCCGGTVIWTGTIRTAGVATVVGAADEAAAIKFTLIMENHLKEL